MQIDLLRLCDALEGQFDSRLHRMSASDMLVMLRQVAVQASAMAPVASTPPQTASQAIRTPSGQQGTSQGKPGQGGLQASVKAPVVQGTQQGRAAVANSQRPERVRAVVELPGQGTNIERSAGELRALQLLREGYSERRLLDTLKAEGLKLDKSKLKGLRAEAQ